MIYACLWICLLVFCGRRTVMGNLLLYVNRPRLYAFNAHFKRNKTSAEAKKNVEKQKTYQK